MTPTIERQDGPAGRFYKIGSALYPSVTHILASGFPKPALMYWAASEERKLVSATAADLYADFAKEIVPPQLPRAAYLATLAAKLGPAKAHQKALAKAADLGTEAHQKVEWWLRTQMGVEAGPEPNVRDQAEWAVMAFQDWARAVSLKVLLIERTVYSTVHGFAGTLDLLARVKGVPTCIDLKTSKAIYAESFLQSAAYQTALVEMGYLPPAGGGLIVRLPKIESDPAFEVVPVPPIADLLPTFLAVQQVWRFTYAQDEAFRTRTTTTKVA
jgi:hypothetical protein